MRPPRSISTWACLKAFLLLILPLRVMTQSGWLQPSSTWTETFAYFDGLYFHHAAFDITVNGDTVIGGQDYHRLVRTGTDTLRAIGETDPYAILPLDQYLGALREDMEEQRWWVVFADFLNEQQLYDFDLTDGEMVSGTFGDCSENYVVGSIDTVQLGDSWRRRFHIGPWGRFIIEGIGSSDGLFGHLCPFIEEYGCLQRYAVNGDVLVVDGCGSLSVSVPERSSREEVMPFPNPVVDRCTIGSRHAGRPVHVFDATGRVVARPRIDGAGAIDMRDLAPGTYLLQLKDGRHRVVKE